MSPQALALMNTQVTPRHWAGRLLPSARPRSRVRRLVEPSRSPAPPARAASRGLRRATTSATRSSGSSPPTTAIAKTSRRV